MALSDILDRILGDAAAEAGEIRRRGREEAQKVLDEARAEAAALRADLIAQGEGRLKWVMENELSSARLAAQRELLSLRKELLDDLFGQVPEFLHRLPAGEYAEILASFVDDEALILPGELETGRADVEHFGDEFSSLVVESVSKGRRDCRISPSRRPGTHERGVVIRAARVVHDFSLEALLSEVRPRIEGRAAAFLFPS